MGESQAQGVAHGEQLSTSRGSRGAGGERSGMGKGAPETEGSQGGSGQLCGLLEKVGGGSPAGVADFYCIDLQGRTTLLEGPERDLKALLFPAGSGFGGFSRFLKSAHPEDLLLNLSKLGCRMKTRSRLWSERTCSDCPGKKQSCCILFLPRLPWPDHEVGWFATDPCETDSL